MHPCITSIDHTGQNKAQGDQEANGHDRSGDACHACQHVVFARRQQLDTPVVHRPRRRFVYAPGTAHLRQPSPSGFVFFFFETRQKKLLPYINIGGENKGPADASNKKPVV
jgi:hypothetical protein